MAEPYVKKDAGDMIRANDWNEMQSKAREAIEGHQHTGDGNGARLTGAAIDPAAELHVKSVAAKTLSVAGVDLSERLEALLKGVNAALPLAGGTLAGQLTAQGGILVVDSDIRLRDEYHGLGYFGGGKRFAGEAPEGPVLFGYSGGGLGSTDDSPKLALTWDAKQNVTIHKDLTVKSDLTVNKLLAGAGGIALGDNLLRLRTAGDDFHGLGYFHGEKRFANEAPDGPVLFGHGGGGLGSKEKNSADEKLEKLALTWDAKQNVTIHNDLTVTGRITATKAARETRTSKIKAEIKKPTDWSTLPEMEFSFVSTGGKMLLIFKAGGVQTHEGSSKTTKILFRMILDRTEKTYCIHEFHNLGWELRDVSLTALVDADPGTHDLKIEWKVDDGDGGTIAVCSLHDAQRSLMAIEL